MQINLNRETLAEQVARQLVERIEGEAMPPGAFLPSMTKLATDFGVSKPIVREALKSLEARGIIEVANGRGAIVKPVNSDPLRGFFQRAVRVRRQALLELLEVRKGVEVQSAMLAAERRTDEELARIAETVAAMRRMLHDTPAYTQLDTELHLLIAAASHNEIMYHLVESIRDPLKDTIREGLRSRHSDEQLDRVQELHERLLAALERGNASEAAQAMRVHFDEAVMALVRDTDVG